ncbi:MAG TPA: hypothetical protein VFI65_31220 [Streptosporangiaceae bacterium]|nr:hypothetical protein [Streptosporangiaceae bacterium]
MGEHALAAYAVGFTTGIAVTALAVTYHYVWRQRLVTWGSTPAEAAADLPGDEFMPDGAGPGGRPPGTPRWDLVTTRAVAISAPPSCVWPWLTQMGSGRAGRYSYDWIENLFGLDMHSAEVILPQFQNIVPGDEFPIGGRHGVMRVKLVEPEQNLALEFCQGRWVSSFALLPQAVPAEGGRPPRTPAGAAAQAGGTRLVNRTRAALPHLSPVLRRICTLALEPCGFFFDRKMLLGIKERAERLAGERDLVLSYPGQVPSHLWKGEQL